MFWRKKKAEKPTRSTGNILALDVLPGKELSVREPDDLVGISGTAFGGEFIDGEYVVASKQGGRSRSVLNAREGDVWQLSSSLRVVYKSQGDTDVTVLAGPLFMDARGQILKWWRPLACVAGPISVEAVAPPGTAYVAAGLYGAWLKDAEPPLVKVAFSATTLSRSG